MALKPEHIVKFITPVYDAVGRRSIIKVFSSRSENGILNVDWFCWFFYQYFISIVSLVWHHLYLYVCDKILNILMHGTAFDVTTYACYDYELVKCPSFLPHPIH